MLKQLACEVLAVFGGQETLDPKIKRLVEMARVCNKPGVGWSVKNGVSIHVDTAPASVYHAIRGGLVDGLSATYEKIGGLARNAAAATPDQRLQYDDHIKSALDEAAAFADAIAHIDPKPARA